MFFSFNFKRFLIIASLASLIAKWLRSKALDLDINLSSVRTGSIASEVDILRVIDVWKIHDAK